MKKPIFFRDGERLVFLGTDIHPDYQLYNRITRRIRTSKLGEIAVENVFRIQEKIPKPLNLEFSLWRVMDPNGDAEGRGVDLDPYTITKANGERVAYILTHRMHTDPKDPYPCEYTRERDLFFEDVIDPRTILIARSYRGVVAEIAKDIVLDYSEPFRYRYHCWNGTRYVRCSEPLFMNVLTSQAVEMFAPNVQQEAKYV